MASHSALTQPWETSRALLQAVVSMIGHMVKPVCATASLNIAAKSSVHGLSPDIFDMDLDW